MRCESQVLFDAHANRQRRPPQLCRHAHTQAVLGTEDRLLDEEAVPDVVSLLWSLALSFTIEQSSSG